MTIRRLTPSDVSKVTPLMAELGYPTNDISFAERVAAVSENTDDGVLLAEEAGAVVGVIAMHSFEMLHRPGRLGRITALVVSASARRRGVGHQLLSAAESHLRSIGCVKLEVTSGESRSDAHGFYAAHGYEEQRIHFVKSLQPNKSLERTCKDKLLSPIVGARRSDQPLGDSVSVSPQLPRGFPLPPVDADGNPLAPGAMVEIQTIPDWLTHDLPEAEVVALRALEGSRQRILRFDDNGFAWFGHGNSSGWFCLKPDDVRLSRQESQA